MTPIENLLDNIDFTYNEHILKNADKITIEEKDFIIEFVKFCKQHTEKTIEELFELFKI
jgi:hypothetical protein